MRKIPIPALLSFNAGFVDTGGFLALQGLFMAHVTGNFVTLGATLVLGTHGVVAKLMALPEFILIIAFARVLGSISRKIEFDALRLLLWIEGVLLVALFVLAVRLGPFSNSDSPAALLVGFMGIAAMAIQNAVQRVHFPAVPPTTMMTGNTTQAILDVIDLCWGAPAGEVTAIKARFHRTIRGIGFFAAGCAAAAGLYAWIGLLCFALPAAVGLTAAIAGKSPERHP